MDEFSIIINGVRYDAVDEEDVRSCRGCDILNSNITVTCLLSAVCVRSGVIFKKSTKSFEK